VGFERIGGGLEVGVRDDQVAGPEEGRVQRDGRGAGQLVDVGALNPSLPIATTIQPQFAIGALTATET